MTRMLGMVRFVFDLAYRPVGIPARNPRAVTPSFCNENKFLSKVESFGYINMFCKNCKSLWEIVLTKKTEICARWMCCLSFSGARHVGGIFDFRGGGK